MIDTIQGYPPKRSLLFRIAIWLGIGILIFSLLLISMPANFALMRAFSITLGLAFIHYINREMFMRTVPRGKRGLYFALVVGLAVGSAVGRLLLEGYILPSGSQPFYFKAWHSRLVFLLLTTAITCFVSSLLLFTNYFSTREKAMLQVINAGNEAKLQYLQSQINPHFLFNALNNIYSLVLTHSDKAPDMLLTLTNMLRYSVYQKAGTKIALSHEAEQIDFLVKLFCLKSDEPYNIKFSQSNMQGFVEPMILLPIVENCLKHCDFDVNEKAFANIELLASSKNIILKTENSFGDIKTHEKEGGVGLVNIKERLNLVYPGKHQLHIESENHIYKVDLTIQWNS